MRGQAEEEDDNPNKISQPLGKDLIPEPTNYDVGVQPPNRDVRSRDERNKNRHTFLMKKSYGRRPSSKPKLNGVHTININSRKWYVVI